MSQTLLYMNSIGYIAFAKARALPTHDILAQGDRL
jgi:hypothetical protein